MRIRIRANFFSLFVVTALCASWSAAHAQKTPLPEKQSRAELAISYEFVHSNAPPGSCSCINLNGGGGTFALPLKSSPFAIVGDVGVTHAGGISVGSFSLTLSTFLGGVRYSPRLAHSTLQPFGQVLAGLGHSSGTLVSGQNPSVGNAGAAFAASVGGGLDLPVNRRISFRLVEADYLVTTFDNAVNDHQNNLRLSTGIVLHF